jgi:hypothetical protein
VTGTAERRGLEPLRAFTRRFSSAGAKRADAMQLVRTRPVLLSGSKRLGPTREHSAEARPAIFPRAAAYGKRDPPQKYSARSLKTGR